ncbi:MAG TPA: hypothetical protein VH025_08055 [Solirubrobacteraceae bacterium]|nr:hypothetical protein [Solirubrobacteraceae bacterium]
MSRRARAELGWSSAGAVVLGLGLSLACTSAACKPKASGAQCDQLLERYAQLVVTERFADASTEQIKTEREREKSEARGDDAFKNCSSEVSQLELDCAMHAASADALEKCLE